MKQLNIDINKTFGEVITDVINKWDKGNEEVRKIINDTFASGTIIGNSLKLVEFKLK